METANARPLLAPETMRMAYPAIIAHCIPAAAPPISLAASKASYDEDTAVAMFAPATARIVTKSTGLRANPRVAATSGIAANMDPPV